MGINGIYGWSLLQISLQSVLNYTFFPVLAEPVIYALTKGSMNGEVDDKNRDKRNKSMNH